MSRTRVIVLAILAGIGWNTGAALAQSSSRDRTNPYRGSPLFWDVEKVLDHYVDSLARYYNLTDTQKEFTRQLTTKRFKRFMGTYEQDVRYMMAEMMEYQLNRQIPPGEIAKEWAKRTQPLMNAIRGEIMNGTMEWRDILNDDQKKMHDRDLKLLGDYFNTWDERLNRWSKGDVRDTDFTMGAQQPRVVTGKPVMLQKPEDAWDIYVRTFKRIYKLDDEQRNTADSILREIKNEASRYRNAHKDEFALLDASFEEIRTSSVDRRDKDALEKTRQRVQELREQQKKLEESISVTMFHRLKNELEKIPTLAQRKARQDYQEQLVKIAEARSSATQPSSTQPATTTRPAAGNAKVDASPN